MSFPTITPGDMGLIILVAVIALWTIVFKILNNRRQAVRNELHGTVTYTIKGYSGPETVRIAKALRAQDETEPVMHTTVVGASSKDVRS